MGRVAIYPTTMSVRLTPEDAERIKRAAAACSMSSADFMRAILLDACSAIEEEAEQETGAA